MTDSRKALVSVVASVVVVGLVVTLVLVFAVVTPPDFPLLESEPDPAIDGTVAFIHWDRDQQCLLTVPASGGPTTEVICEHDIGFGDFAPGWTPDGNLVVQEFGPRSEVFRIVDPRTGETIERVPFEESPAYDRPIQMHPFGESPDGLLVDVSGSRGEPELVVFERAGADQVVVSAEGPADYWFEWATWSPDGRWILFQDSEQRLIVVGASGTPGPRILVDDVDSWMGAAWYIPGYEHGTWDPTE